MLSLPEVFTNKCISIENLCTSAIFIDSIVTHYMMRFFFWKAASFGTRKRLEFPFNDLSHTLILYSSLAATMIYFRILHA